MSVIEFENGTIGVSETGFVTNGIPYVMEMQGTKGGLMVHNDILEYTCEETGNKLVADDRPAPRSSTSEALSTPGLTPAAALGEAPNGIDDAVALTKFMVGAYESYNTGKKYVF